MAIDISKLSTAQLDRLFHLQAIVARQEEEAKRVVALRNYYDGVHPVLLTDRQEEFIGKMLTEGEFEFSHNTVKSIVDTLRERLNVTGFTVNGIGTDAEGETSPAQKIAAQLWSWWEDNRYDAQQIRLHRRAIRDGKSYVMVDYDPVAMRPRFTLHSVYDGTTGIVIHRDPENPELIMYMCKYFYTYDPLEPGKTGIERKTVYLPGEIRKYIRGGGGEYNWRQYSDPEDNNVWPLPWKDRDGTPLGITLIEFENPGGSEVAQIIGLQNLLNKAWLDLVAASDASGFPIVAIEYESDGAFPTVTDDEDITGDDEFIIAPGRALEIEGGRAHRIEGANLTGLIDVINLTVETIAGVSHTPSYYLRPVGGSDVPSGEALKMLESGLVKRAEERQLIFGQAWSDIMLMAYKVERAFGSANLPELPNMKIQTVWDSPHTRNEKSDAEMGEIWKRLGIPDEEIWAILGMSPKQIAKFKAMRRTDAAEATAAVVGAIQRAQASAPTRPGAIVPPAGTPNATDAPENIDSTEGLNGIQIRAAVELLDKVAAKAIAPNIALELLISLGIERARAQAMVNDAQRFAPAVSVNGNGANGNGVTA